MADNATVFQYHERSKHHLHGYAPGPRGLDWASQPDPFRTYASAPSVAFALAADALPGRFSDLRAGRLPSPVRVSAESIGVMLELSLAISAWKSYRGSTWASRCNPSSGNLHPSEGYIITAEVIPADVFCAMLEPLLHRAGAPPWNAWPWPVRAHLALFIRAGQPSPDSLPR